MYECCQFGPHPSVISPVSPGHVASDYFLSALLTSASGHLSLVSPRSERRRLFRGCSLDITVWGHIPTITLACTLTHTNVKIRETEDKTEALDSKLVNECPQDSDFDPKINEFRTALVTAKAKVTSWMV